MADTIRWSGSQAFYVVGTGHEDDTLRVVAGHRKAEELLSLVLPTLCITYADMAFANAIGGTQKDYPDSADYGPGYFDPPRVLNGPKEIEKFTWIRGAERVTIGPRETLIEWLSLRTLVIPKLRIAAGKKAAAVLKVPEVDIRLSQPLTIQAMQFTDGRHVGGVQLTKRHPDWKPEPFEKKYGLWLRCIDGQSGRGIAEARVSLYTWDKEGGGSGGRFVPEAEWYTDGMGVVRVPGLPCSDKKLIVVESRKWLSQTWRFRPLPGQEVRRTFKLWQNKKVNCSYRWKEKDTLDSVAALSDSYTKRILDINKLTGDIKPGQTIEIPCYEAIYHVEARDTLERLTEHFGFQEEETLAQVNGLSKPYKLYQDQALRLPGWRFFIAPEARPFREFDEKFGLSAGWVRPAQRTLHDNPDLAYAREVLAVPTLEFVEGHKLA